MPFKDSIVLQVISILGFNLVAINYRVNIHVIINLLLSIE